MGMAQKGARESDRLTCLLSGLLRSNCGLNAYRGSHLQGLQLGQSLLDVFGSGCWRPVPAPCLHQRVKLLLTHDRLAARFSKRVAQLRNSRLRSRARKAGCAKLQPIVHFGCNYGIHRHLFCLLYHTSKKPYRCLSSVSHSSACCLINCLSSGSLHCSAIFWYATRDADSLRMCSCRWMNSCAARCDMGKTPFGLHGSSPLSQGNDKSMQVFQPNFGPAHGPPIHVIIKDVAEATRAGE